MAERQILKQQVCFALYSTSRSFTAFYRPMLEELGLTYPQYLVLMLLWEQDRASVTELGEALQLDSGTLSPLLKRLESSGLIRRRRSNDDERRVEIELTDDGVAMQRRASAIPAQLAEAAGIGIEELTQLCATLSKLNASLRHVTTQ
ncbi:MarR family winged helix-turn-helix transcriptional regulator [Psychromicrobium sp. YIM B11713]|uniref:MarR family winged helix-turn-helix transcriptional regulator n=1 Tax=Psychromicrobium sp. YIM B11713 TaxID=3145233 RepID=UPI00374F4CFB